MQLDLTRYRQPLSHFTGTFEPGAVAQEGDAYRIVEPVHVDFDINKDKNRFRLVGQVRTALELQCSRCVEAYRLPVESSFDLRYLPASEMATEGEQEVADEDLGISYYRDDQIDLDELIREQLYLALPMKPLCRDACAGLCPQCGINRNTGTCDCGPDWEDPRFAALKRLKQTSDHA